MLNTKFVYSNCEFEIKNLAEDLKKIELTQRKTQAIIPLLLKARNLCFAKRSEEALKLISKARQLANLKPSKGEFDWENIPLDELEE